MRCHGSFPFGTCFDRYSCALSGVDNQEFDTATPTFSQYTFNFNSANGGTFGTSAVRAVYTFDSTNPTNKVTYPTQNAANTVSPFA